MSAVQTAPFAVAVALFLVIAAFIAYSVIKGRGLMDRRQKELASWARANGLTFNPGPDPSIGARFPLFQCLQMGDHRRASNIMEGTVGQRPVCAFDYYFETHSGAGKERRTSPNYLWVLAVESGLPLKPLFIRPEAFYDKVTEFIGFEEIGFESAEFSRRYVVSAPNRRWAFDVLHQKTIELMLCYPSFKFEFQGTQAMAYRDSGEWFSAGDFACALKVLTGILDYLPESVVRELKEPRSGPRP